MKAFQSLLHQGISLLQPEKCHRVQYRFCFNPFFIRASVYWIVLQAAAARAALPFQSLLHQGISLLVEAPSPEEAGQEVVSIPSSSGHQFTGFPGSPLHIHSPCFNPFFIRASVYWFTKALVHKNFLLIVSIPSSSGHQFTASVFPLRG